MQCHKVVELMCGRQYDTASKDRCRDGEHSIVDIPVEYILRNKCDCCLYIQSLFIVDSMKHHVPRDNGCIILPLRVGPGRAGDHPNNLTRMMPLPRDPGPKRRLLSKFKTTCLEHHHQKSPSSQAAQGTKEKKNVRSR